MFKNLKFEFWVFVLLFGLLAVFLIHNFDSIGQDIGRHLKTGEIIWQTKEVPKTNLFSFTEPDFPFTNHHWLSEVIFYNVFNLGGLTWLILLKVFFILIAFLLLFFVAKKHATFWPLVISFLLSIFIFISRTEVRPEIFSFLMSALFLSALFKAKYDPNWKLKIKNLKFSPLWFLPLAQLLWVNLHIYFFIGPFLFVAFFVDRLFQYEIRNTKYVVLKLLAIGGLIVLATFINPAGIKGALLPFNILKEYGYSIVENQTLSFFTDFFGFNLSIFVFKVSVVVLVVSFLLMIKKTKERIFEILISAFFIYAGFKMLRNLPLYALGSFSVLAILLTDIFRGVGARLLATSNAQRTFDVNKRTDGILKVVVVGFLAFMLFFVASGGYYKWANLSKVVGFSVPNGLERAVDFVKENKIEGPMFNNFDIGGYLIWQIEGVRYPVEKVPDPFRVFVDNRPEAYSVEFFSETYKSIQDNPEKWKEFSDNYGINFIFFAHTDATPWGRSFITNITKNPDWKTAYLNEDVIILVKNNSANSEVISKFYVTEENAVNRALDFAKDSNENPINLNLTFSRFFYNISWRKTAVYFADEAIKLAPENPYPYLYKGLAYAYYTDGESQKLAGENIKKATDLGLKESRYYYILGVVYMNLNRLDEAKLLFEKALELDESNKEAKEFLEKYF